MARGRSSAHSPEFFDPTGEFRSHFLELFLMDRGLRSSSAYAMCLLLISYALNFADRQLITILLNDIRHDLQLTDTQLGLISGSGFAIFYILAGLPLGWLADRTNRTRLLAVSIAGWSMMTAACGVVANFVQLFAARVGVGFGEAGATPAALSLISDYYPASIRASRMGVYFSGAAISTVLAYAVGGWLGAAVGWRWTFAMFGLPGVLTAFALAFTLEEPARNRWGDADSSSLGMPSTGALNELLRIPEFLVLCIGFMGSNFALYGIIAWGPSIAMRTYALGSGKTGIWLGMTAGIATGFVHFFGGRFSDWLLRFGRHLPVLYSAITQAICLAMTLLFLLAKSFPLFSVFFALAYAIGAAYTAPTFATAHALVPPSLRASAAALMLLLGAIAGLGFGPLAIGIVSDALHSTAGEDSLRLAAFIIPAVGLTAPVAYSIVGLRLKSQAPSDAFETLPRRV
jgi:MFS family permease